LGPFFLAGIFGRNFLTGWKLAGFGFGLVLALALYALLSSMMSTTSFHVVPARLIILFHMPSNE
jgi:hypothetical protein